MTLLTAIAFVALGFVAGCVVVGGLWAAATKLARTLVYEQGYDDGHHEGRVDGIGEVLSLVCRTCQDSAAIKLRRSDDA